MNIDNFIDNIIPRFYKSKEEYYIFVELVKNIFSEIYNDTYNFTDIIDVDLCIDKFLPYLSALIGFPYDETKTANSQRQDIIYYLDSLKDKGTEKSVIKNILAGWLDYNEEIDYLILYRPDTHIFRYSDYSLLSDVYIIENENYWRRGVFEIQATPYNEDIREKVELVRPAGLRVWYFADIMLEDLIWDDMEHELEYAICVEFLILGDDYWDLTESEYSPNYEIVLPYSKGGIEEESYYREIMCGGAYNISEIGDLPILEKMLDRQAEFECIKEA